ncbi:MAG: YIP1 family protein [Qingshengfaniella sp.]
MSVTAQIAATYRGPGRVMHGFMAGPVREDRALVYLMLACLLMFLAQWPRLIRTSLSGGAAPVDAALGAALFGWLFMAPLFFYALAALARILAALLGGAGTWYGARMALFWALLATTPLWLVAGLVAGVAGQGWISDLAGLIPALAFLVIWLLSMRAAEAQSGANRAEET